MEHNFKLGDTVRLKPNTKSLKYGFSGSIEFDTKIKNGSPGKIVKLVGPNALRIDFDGGPQSFSVLHTEIELARPAKAQSWTFKSRNWADIDTEALRTELSKQHPVLLTTSPDNDHVLILFHPTLIQKALNCELDIPRAIDRNTFMVETQTRYIPVYINWAKAVKRAPWAKEFRSQITIKATKVNI